MAKQNKIFPNHPSIICGENNAYLFVVTLWIQVIQLNRGRLGGLLYILDKKKEQKNKKGKHEGEKNKKNLDLFKIHFTKLNNFHFPAHSALFQKFRPSRYLIKT